LLKGKITLERGFEHPLTVGETESKIGRQADMGVRILQGKALKREPSQGLSISFIGGRIA